MGEIIEDKKGVIAFPVKEMLDKRKRGAGFKNSSHYKAFTISRTYIKNGQWEFENVMTKEIEMLDKGQLSIFNSANERQLR
jgi:CO dehydrogenase/acetyl-CoA synthase epsilon subunit